MMMTSTRPTPPHSRSSSSSSPKRLRLDLTLDLSDLPPLITPAPPSNTLLVTNLNDPEIFAQQTLVQIRRLIDDQTDNGVHTFSPLKSMRRIIVTFYTTEAATAVRSLLDGENLFNSRIRIYFGEAFPIDETEAAQQKRLLKAPKSDKQFFISPPPSPPVGWEVREEDPPNKDVHAEDLAVALERLNAKGLAAPAPAQTKTDVIATPPSSNTATAAHVSDDESSRAVQGAAAAANARKRSGSIIVYDPQECGHSPDLPAIAVEDTTGCPDLFAADGMNVVSSTAMPKTEMPPTDLKFDN